MKIILSFVATVFWAFSLNAQCDPGGGGTGGGGGSISVGVQSAVGGTTSGSFANSAFHSMHTQTVFKARQGDRLSYSNVKGNPYLNKSATAGTLVMNDGNMIKDILLQFDLYTNDVIATLESGEEIVLDSKYFREVIIPTKEKDVVYRKINPEKPNDFYEVLYQDEDMAFFKQRYVTLREGQNNGLAKVKPRFDKRTKYFIRHGQGEVAKVKLKKKDIFSEFVDGEIYAMKEYAREKGIKFKDETDYVAVFEGIYSDSAAN